MCGRRISFRRGKEIHGADIDNTKKYQRKKTKAKKNKCSNKMLRFTDEGSIIKESG
jgi:hypothetical protein